MGAVLHRSLLANPPTAVRGEGVYLYDESGRQYLDGCGGAAVSCLGHNHPAVTSAIVKQLERVPFAHTSFFTTEGLEELGTRLVSMAPGLDKALFVSGGSEAVEAALKLSRQYFVERGQADRRYFIGRRQSYHGNTLGALSVGGNLWRRRMFEPILREGQLIAPCYEYRERPRDESSEEYGLRVADELQARIHELGPSNVAAFVAETVVGATSGAVPAVPGYFRRIREICDRYDIHLILDEVMCGAGRTGTYFAYEQEGIAPDIAVLSKGLAAGYQPIGAMLCTDEIAECIRQGSGFFQHGHTFMGHATATAAALATIRVIEDEGLLQRVTDSGRYLRQRLDDALGEHCNVGDIRGRGLFIGVELVDDRNSKSTLDPALKTHNRVQVAAMRRGLMCYGMGGTVDGRHGDHILIAPPYIVEKPQLDELVERLVAAVHDVLPGSAETQAAAGT